jgi:hypothetical protein
VFLVTRKPSLILLFFSVLPSRSCPRHRPSNSSKLPLPPPLLMLPSSPDLLCWRPRLQLMCPQRTKRRRACSHHHHRQQHHHRNRFKRQLEAARRLFWKKIKNAAASLRGYLGPGSRKRRVSGRMQGQLSLRMGMLFLHNRCFQVFCRTIL